MDNSIKESYCSFEVSKMLKEIGFDCECNQIWYEQISTYINRVERNILFGDYQHIENLKKHEIGFIIKRPTHALAIEWLRINFGIYITIIPTENCDVFWYQIRIKNKILYTGNNENNPYDFTEAAIKLILNKLLNE